MEKHIYIFILLCLCTNTLFGQSEPDIDKLVKSVVIVKSFDNYGAELGHGSGVIIDSKGTCVTNYHVLDSAYSIKIITEDGKEYDMDKITGENKECDLIRFTIRSSGNNFIPVIPCKKSPKRGNHIWAIGTPLFLENKNSVTDGIISNVYPNFRFTNDTVFQITADISHGSSGGGLFNNKGELVGIPFLQFSGADAGRAGLNYAIYVGEISKLRPVYKDRLESAIPKIADTYVPPKYKTPEPPKYEYHQPETGKVSFYTDWNKPIEISVDYQNHGTTSNFFTTGTPQCGQEGTKTFSLRPGTYGWSASYSYEISNVPMEYTWNGTVTVTANDCKLVFLPKPKHIDEKKAAEYKPKQHSENKVPVRSWMLGVGTSGGTAFYLDKYFRNGKYDLQLSFDGFVYGNSDQSTGFNYSWNKYGIGYYRVFSTNEGYIDFAFRTGPSIRYLMGSYSADSYNGKINDVFINWRAGVDVLIANRILIRGEGGYGYATQGWIVSQSVYPVVSYSSDLLNPKFTYDYDLLLGYKFGKIKKRYKTANPVVKHIPELLLPGETDIHLSKKLLLHKTEKSYARKGHIKIGLFFASAATAIGSNIYSNSEYSKYSSGDPNTNMTHYNNANLAHKIALTSSALVVGLYLNDIVHFCAKIKTIKNQ